MKLLIKIPYITFILCCQTMIVGSSFGMSYQKPFLIGSIVFYSAVFILYKIYRHRKATRFHKKLSLSEEELNELFKSVSTQTLIDNDTTIRIS